MIESRALNVVERVGLALLGGVVASTLLLGAVDAGATTVAWLVGAGTLVAVVVTAAPRGTVDSTAAIDVHAGATDEFADVLANWTRELREAPVSTAPSPFGSTSRTRQVAYARRRRALMRAAAVGTAPSITLGEVIEP